jgi:predicted GNAT superfamily acetyltransferase
VVTDVRGATLRAWVPEDAVAIRQRDPQAGRAWRLALRESFGAAINDGYRATSITRDGWYTLTR